MISLLKEESTKNHVANDDPTNAYMRESEGDQYPESIFDPWPKVASLIILQITHLISLNSSKSSKCPTFKLFLL